ncbi:MAG TPA: AsmA family protein [Verrucomicrobiae bacterium]|nr:AsmA family protein [Verrucomicrobiae bacterium]
MSRKIVPVVLILITALLVVFNFSLNGLIARNRARIQEDLERLLGRAVTFRELTVSLWGGPAVAASDLQIAEDPSFAATPFLQAKELRMRLRWLPLLAGRLRIEKFILEQPEIQIIKNEAGVINIAALAPPRDKRSKPPAETPSDGGREKKPASPPRHIITGININNGSIDYIDRTAREPIEIRVRRLDLSASGALNSPAKIKLSGELFEGEGRNFTVQGEAGPLSGRSWSQAPINLRVRCDSLLLAQLTRAVPPLRSVFSGYLQPNGPISFDSQVLGILERPRFVGLNLTGAFFGAAGNNITLKGDLDFSRGAPESAALKLRLVIDPLPLEQLKTIPFFSQAMPSSLLVDGPVNVSADLEGTPAALKIRAAIKGDESEIVYGSWLKKAKGVAADLTLDMERDKDRIVFGDSTLALNNSKIKFSGAIDEIPERRLSLNLSADALALANFEKLLLPLSAYDLGGHLSARLTLAKTLDTNTGLAIRGAVSLDKIQVKERRSGRGVERATGEVSFHGKDARVDRLILHSGATDVAIGAGIADVSQPVLRYSMRSPMLKPADFGASAVFRSDEMKAFASTGEISLREGKPWLRGGVSSSEGTLTSVPYRNLRGDIVWGPSTFSFKNVALQTLSGSIRAAVSWDTAADNSVRLSAEPNIETVELKTLLKRKIPGLEEYLDGRLSLKGTFRAAAKNISALPQALAGAGETQIRGGALKDFNLLRLVLVRVVDLHGSPRRWPQPLATLAERKDTPFETLTANFTVQGGRAYSKNLLLSAANYAIGGQGSVGLDKTLQWDALLTLTPEITQELARDEPAVRSLVDRNGSLAVPFRVGGNLAHVRVSGPAKADAAAVR